MISLKTQALMCSAVALGLAAALWAADDTLTTENSTTAASQPAMAAAADFPKDYKGTPYEDARYKAGAQRIPGKLMLAYFDLGGEGVAYHIKADKNNGSGGLNPLNGEYKNEFRAKEKISTSYTKDFADKWEGQKFFPPMNMMYVGWTQAGQWQNYTVDVAEDGTYTVDFAYTSNMGGVVSIDVNGKALDKLDITTTNDPADTTGWRQWHHWNLAKGLTEVKLSKGRNLITFHMVDKGNMNLGYLDFKKK